MSDRSTTGKKTASKSAPAIALPDESDLRDLVSQDEFESNFDVNVTTREQAAAGRIFGMTAGERMILSIIIFMAVSVLGIALLFATQTIVIP